MNYLERIGEEESKKMLGFYVKRLIKGYGQDVSDAEDYKNTVSLLYKELKQIKYLNEEQIVNTYKRMMRSYTKYRRFTVSGFLTELYENG